MDIHTLDKNIASKVRSEVNCAMTKVKTRVQDAVSTAIESLVILKVELAMKSANASSERNLNGNVLEPDHKDFPGNIDGLQMMASSRINSDTKINETRGNITVEEANFFVNEKNHARQTHTYHI